MPPCTIRAFRSMEDTRAQYALWLAATEGLTRPWRSSLRNVEHQCENARKYPGCRFFAQRADGTLAGYIGTHPPFEWIAEDHGPPARSLGWAIPFGFPWTWPRDEGLEIELYERMCASVPETYGAFQRDLYIQRFRESWAWVTGCLVERGWKLHDRLPLLGRAIGDTGRAPADLALVTRADLEWVRDLSGRDATGSPLTLGDLQRRYDEGWIAPESLWRLGERGVFALEARGKWCAVTLLIASEADWDATLAAAATMAAKCGAEEVYFTVDAGDARLRGALEARGFGEVDAGVYYVREAD